MYKSDQYLRVAAITPVNEWVSCFRLESADNIFCGKHEGFPANALKPLIPFKPGQYINIYYTIGKTKTSRPYSIASSPLDAQNGFYELFIHKGGPFTARWLFENVHEGDILRCSSPTGEFCIDPKSDTPKIIAISGGMSVTPLRSIAKAVTDGTLGIDLTIISGWDHKDEIIFDRDFRNFEKRCDRLKTVFTVARHHDSRPGIHAETTASVSTARTIPSVTTAKKVTASGATVARATSDETTAAEITPDEAAEKNLRRNESLRIESGYCDGAMIRRHCDIKDATFFLCGPQEMYKSLFEELRKLGVPRNRVRCEIPGELQTPAGQPDYPGTEKDSWTLTCIVSETRRLIPASAGETLLVALERAGIATDARCRCGCCPHCESRLVRGDIYIPAVRDFRTAEQKTQHQIHLCCAFPLSDVEIIVENENNRWCSNPT